MIYIVNCTLHYLFEGIAVEMLDTHAKLSLAQRILNRFRNSPVIPEDMSAYENLSHADVVILFGGTRQFFSRCKHIEEHVLPTAQLNLYLWNPMFFYTDDVKRLDGKWKVWTFSKKDAEKYHIRYAETFYNEGLHCRSKITTDMFFVGLEKGRFSLLDELSKVACKVGLVADINIVDNIKKIYSSKYVGRMAYSEVQRRISRTRALVDIVQSNQSGLTQRVLESLFFKKKLITNNASIKDYKFYTPENIFVIGEDDYSHLKEFVLSPYTEVCGFDAKDFDVHQWLNRMINNKEFHE